MKKVLDIWRIGCYYIEAVGERHERNETQTADVPCKLNNEKHAILKHLGQFLIKTRNQELCVTHRIGANVILELS